MARAGADGFGTPVKLIVQLFAPTTRQDSGLLFVLPLLHLALPGSGPLQSYNRNMPRKREKDLRDFWPWYERTVRRGFVTGSSAPPFRLGEIAGKEPPLPGLRWLRLIWIAGGVLLVVTFVWRLFH